MGVNRRIIVASFILIASGIYSTTIMHPTRWMKKTTITRIIIGGYLLAILAAVVDLVSPDAGYLAGAVMMVAVLTMLLTVLPDLAGRISGR